MYSGRWVVVRREERMGGKRASPPLHIRPPTFQPPGPPSPAPSPRTPVSSTWGPTRLQPSADKTWEAPVKRPHPRFSAILLLESLAIAHTRPNALNTPPLNILKCTRTVEQTQHLAPAGMHSRYHRSQSRLCQGTRIARNFSASRLPRILALSWLSFPLVPASLHLL